jgi:hypothetical protein
VDSGITKATAKQGTRLLKVVCPDAACGVVLRITRRYIDQGRIPTCACGNKMHTEPHLRLVGSSVELSTGESFQVAYMGILWALATSAKRGLTTEEPFDLGVLRVTKINGHGDIYAIKKTAREPSNYRLLIRFAEIESVAVLTGLARKGGDGVCTA